MKVTIKSKATIDLNIEDVIELSVVVDGDDVSIIRKKVRDYLFDSFGVPDDIETNLDDISDIIVDEIKYRLNYYTDIFGGKCV